MTARAKRPWTQEDIVYLRSHYGLRSTHAIARKLRRSVVAIRCAVSHMGIAAHLRSDVDDRTVMTWSSMLGVSDRTINMWVRHGVLNLDEEFDEPYLRTRVISEDTMEMWLRQGNAIRCRPHADTPPYWARLIAEVKAKYISAKQLQRIDATLYPWILLRDCRGMGMVKLEPIRTSDGVHHDNYYLKSEIYDAIYTIGHIAPRHIKDPYIKAIIMAWDSVYVATWQLRQHYKPSHIVGHPAPIIRGVYNRAEVVAWLKTTKDKAHLAQVLRQDPICYRELHRDLDRKAKRGLPI